MKNASHNHDHDQTLHNAPSLSSTNAPRLPRETIPAANEAEFNGMTEQHNARERSFALPLMVGLLVLLGTFSLGAWSVRRSSQPSAIGPIVNRALVARPVIVHVAGAVRKPGVYTLQNGARVSDALQKADGTTKNADLDALNLAALAQDGTKIEVPLKPQTPTQLAHKPVAAEDLKISTEMTNDVAPESFGEETTKPSAELPFASAKAAAQRPLKREAKSTTSSTRSLKSTPKREKTALKKPRVKKEKSKTIAGLPRALTPGGELSNNASTEFLTKHPLDLNRITREQLEALPGVGPSLAARILEYRKANGGFKNVDELDDVKGIGEKKLNDLRPLLRVEGEAQASKEPVAATTDAPQP